ncbi:hypothetical protein BDP27DRAFT_1366254 [Rhodocollybia butyracea]|uniref:Uncharacterized protein n=1 Tax=Rhodocollybia butyracea TaxID=206335 RepID=A0A9P5U019_9AGAR|nr:hypothetical protein BDP27DRAFT_1370137 [Rhodocollybia butyracea]KAF9065662.1 hypothetical protein BDP27DRAFT_1366254 [Rhodocollybia butyracea]
MKTEPIESTTDAITAEPPSTKDIFADAAHAYHKKKNSEALREFWNIAFEEGKKALLEEETEDARRKGMRDADAELCERLSCEVEVRRWMRRLNFWKKRKKEPLGERDLWTHMTDKLNSH